MTGFHRTASLEEKIEILFQASRKKIKHSRGINEGFGDWWLRPHHPGRKSRKFKEKKVWVARTGRGLEWERVQVTNKERKGEWKQSRGAGRRGWEGRE